MWTAIPQCCVNSDHALLASAFHLTYCTHGQCTEETAVTSLALRGSENRHRKGYFNDYGEGWLQLHFFSVDTNTKSICPNPQGQSAHTTKFPLAGISRCPSVKPEPCVARVNTKGKKMSKNNISGWHLSCTCPCD